MFKTILNNVSIIAVLDLSWKHVDSIASARPFHAISFRVKGNAKFKSNNLELFLKTNDIIFVPKALDYHLLADDEKLFCIHFDTDAELPHKIIKFVPSNSIVFEKIFNSMYDKWMKKKPGYYSGVMSDFYKILSKIETQKSETKMSDISDNMNYVMEYIHEHFTDSTLTISQLSKISSLSEPYFRKLFKSTFGISPLKYINSLRVKYATELINSGYYKIYEIAEMAGFNDPKYFSTIIKKYTNDSPRSIKNNL